MTQEERSKHFIDQFKAAAKSNDTAALPLLFAHAVSARQANQGQALEGAAIYVANKVRPRPTRIEDTLTDMHQLFNWAMHDTATPNLSKGVLAGLELLGISPEQEQPSGVIPFVPPSKDRA